MHPPSPYLSRTCLITKPRNKCLTKIRSRLVPFTHSSARLQHSFSVAKIVPIFSYNKKLYLCKTKPRTALTTHLPFNQRSQQPSCMTPDSRNLVLNAAISLHPKVNALVLCRSCGRNSRGQSFFNLCSVHVCIWSPFKPWIPMTFSNTLS
jgi:hypothetical protein